MTKINRLILIVGVGLLASGCHSRLLGDHHETSKAPESFGGFWEGKIVLSDGKPHPMFLILNQSGTTIAADSLWSIDYSGTLAAHVSGGSSGSTFTVAAVGGPACAQPWQLSGELTSGQLLVQIDGDGCNTSGTGFYPNSLHERLILTR